MKLPRQFWTSPNYERLPLCLGRIVNQPSLWTIATAWEALFDKSSSNSKREEPFSAQHMHLNVSEKRYQWGAVESCRMIIEYCREEFLFVKTINDS
jgi:hypothetical protein